MYLVDFAHCMRYVATAHDIMDQLYPVGIMKPLAASNILINQNSIETCIRIIAITYIDPCKKILRALKL